MVLHKKCYIDTSRHINMKTIITTILSFFLLNSCFAQQNIALLGAAITITLPSEVISITSDQVKAHQMKTFPKAMSLNQDTFPLSNKIHFLIKDKLLSMIGQQVTVPVDQATKIKAGLDELFNGNATYSSEIKKYSDQSVVVITFFNNDMRNFKFYSYSNKGDRAATGSLTCKLNDLEGAQLLNQLLDGLKFN